MHCAACGGKTQPELVLRLGRGQSVQRAASSQAHYCWTCGTSTPDAAAAAAPRPRLLARWSRLALRSTPGPAPRDAHWAPPAAACWNSRAGLA